MKYGVRDNKTLRFKDINVKKKKIIEKKFKD